MAGDLDPGQLGDGRSIEPDRAGELGVGGRGPLDEQRSDGLRVDAGGQRERPDQPPPAADPADQRRRDRRGARIERQERPGLVAHALRLTAVPPSARHRDAHRPQDRPPARTSEAKAPAEQGSERTRCA